MVVRGLMRHAVKGRIVKAVYITPRILHYIETNSEVRCWAVTPERKRFGDPNTGGSVDLDPVWMQ
jgi:hypothetical protein